jgi:hypothetical protein
MILIRQLASRDSARWFRLALYATSLVLLAVLVHLGLRLRARAAALRRRAALEHAIAGVSTRLIDSRPDETMADVEQSLTELAGCIGADRAYFVLSGSASHARTWCRSGTGFPPSWPEHALELAARIGQETEGVIHVDSLDRLPAGADRDALAAAGLRSGVCISGACHDDKRGMLGFDALRSSFAAKTDELGLLRMALDAFCGAARRAQAGTKPLGAASAAGAAHGDSRRAAAASLIIFNNIVGGDFRPCRDCRGEARIRERAGGQSPRDPAGRRKGARSHRPDPQFRPPP